MIDVFFYIDFNFMEGKTYLLKCILYIYIYSSAVKRLIASKITVFVYIIYVCVRCIFIMDI